MSLGVSSVVALDVVHDMNVLDRILAVASFYVYCFSIILASLSPQKAGHVDSDKPPCIAYEKHKCSRRYSTS